MNGTGAIEFITKCSTNIKYRRLGEQQRSKRDKPSKSGLILPNLSGLCFVMNIAPPRPLYTDFGFFFLSDGDIFFFLHSFF